MRNAVFWLLAVGLGLALGCAQRDAVVTAMPTPEELPELGGEYATPMQASVGVEGQILRHRARFVPDFTEPELTAEEKVAIGEDFEPYEPPFAAQELSSVGPLQAPWYGGQEAYAWGIGGADSGWYQAEHLPRAFSFRGGQDVGVDRGTLSPGATYHQILDWVYRMETRGGQVVGVDRGNIERSRAMPTISK
jgi:hypothetical protein